MKSFLPAFSTRRPWVNAGKRYDTLVKELGDGCLIVLPKDVTAHEWEKKIPLTGPTHDYAIKSLKERGILEEAARIDADFVATAIFQHVWALLDFLPIDRLHVLADAAILHQQFQNRPIDNLVSPVPGRAPPIAGYVSNNEHTEEFDSPSLEQEALNVSFFPSNSGTMQGAGSTQVDMNGNMQSQPRRGRAEREKDAARQNIPTADDTFDPATFGQNPNFRIPTADETFDTADFGQRAVMQYYIPP
ncbi:hypothetical protein RJZ56_007378 [Blastomyces dermatitidis]